MLMLPGLAAAGYYVLSCDIAGQYESAAAGPENLVPPRAHYDYDLFTNDLLAMLDAEDGPAHVVGYSFAAIFAQLAFTRRPENSAASPCSAARPNRARASAASSASGGSAA